ncbi:MAG: hypothetical protein Kow0047_14900 [Anaerolineae bacterium]
MGLPDRYVEALRVIVSAIGDRPVEWALTGSASMALQGVPVDVHDIDIQTDKDGAFAIADALKEHVTRPVRWSQADRIRSYFGTLEVNGLTVELIGDLQKRLPDGTWEPPVDVRKHRDWVQVGEMRIPVLTIEYEAEAYRKLGRHDRARLLERWLHERDVSSGRS